MRTPRSVVKAIPVARSDGGVDKGRRNGEAPVVVKPPVSKPTCHPLAYSLPPKRHLFFGGLQPAGISGRHWIRVIVEVGSKLVIFQVLKPFSKV